MALYKSDIELNDQLNLRADIDQFLMEIQEGKLQQHIENVMSTPMGRRIVRGFEEEGMTQKEIYDVFIEAAKKSKKKKESSDSDSSDDIDVDDVGNSSDIPDTDDDKDSEEKDSKDKKKDKEDKKDSKKDKKKSKDKKDDEDSDSDSDDDIDIDDIDVDSDDSSDSSESDSKESKDKKKDKEDKKDSKKDKKKSKSEGDSTDGDSIEDKADTGRSNKKKATKSDDSDKDKKDDKEDSGESEDLKLEQVDTSLFANHKYKPNNRRLLQECMDKEFKVKKKTKGKDILKEQMKRPVKEQTSWRLPRGYIPPEKNQYWDKIVRENFDMKDDKTRCVLIACNEDEQNEVLHSLTDKLYDIIVDKAATIDYGSIRDSKGDIQTMTNYVKVVECIELLKTLLIEYKQDTSPVDEIKMALDNVVERTETFKKCYMSGVEFGVLMYENIALAIVASTSLMLSASIEFIKSPSDESFQISVDKVGYYKAKNHLLFTNLQRFNNLCENKQLDKTLDAVISEYGQHFLGASTMTGLGLAALIVVILYNILPMLREITYFFYYTRTRVSDYFNLQADLLELNAQNIESNQKETVGDRKTVIKRQRSIADKFRSVANFFMVDAKTAERSANQAISSDKKTFKSDDVIDSSRTDAYDSSGGSSLF